MFVAFVQAIQEVFTAEEWVNETRNKAKAEAKLRADADKALGAAVQKNKELVTKLTVEQRKKLHYAEIEQAMAQQQVLELKAKLAKAKEATQTIKETGKALA